MGTAGCKGFTYNINAYGWQKGSMYCLVKSAEAGPATYKGQNFYGLTAAVPCPKHKKANYSDDSFLDDMDSFNEAEERRAKYVAEHMALNKARYTKAKIYFKAKDTAALKVRIEGEWNTKWLAAVKKHDDAIAKHEHANKAPRLART